MYLGDILANKLDFAADFDNLELTFSAIFEPRGGWEIAFDLGGATFGPPITASKARKILAAPSV
jgi:hypothetical protein